MGTFHFTPLHSSDYSTQIFYHLIFLYVLLPLFFLPSCLTTSIPSPFTLTFSVLSLHFRPCSSLPVYINFYLPSHLTFMFACLLILVIPTYSGLFISFSSDFFFLCRSIYVYSLPYVFSTYLHSHAGISLSCTDIHTHVQSRRRKHVFTQYVYVVAYGIRHWRVSISAGSVMRLKAETLVTETNVFKSTVGMITKFTLWLF